MATYRLQYNYSGIWRLELNTVLPCSSLLDINLCHESLFLIQVAGRASWSMVFVACLWRRHWDLEVEAKSVNIATLLVDTKRIRGYFQSGGKGGPNGISLMSSHDEVSGARIWDETDCSSTYYGSGMSYLEYFETDDTEDPDHFALLHLYVASSGHWSYANMLASTSPLGHFCRATFVDKILSCAGSAQLK